MEKFEIELKKVFHALANTCLGIEVSETVLIVSDDDCDSKKMGEVLDLGMKDYANEVFLLKMKPRQINGEEPPKLVGEAMSLADVVFIPTSKSLTHTEARRHACSKGARIASMPGIDLKTFMRTMSADYSFIKELTEKLSSMLSQTSDVEVYTDNGTAIEFSIAGKKAIADTGILHEKGSFGNLPAGEAYIAPVEGTAKGIIVFDGTIAGIGILSEPVKVTVVNGIVNKIEGGIEAESLRNLLASVNNSAVYNLGEFGIGTNGCATLSGKILEDEKVLGTIHFAFGDNASMGGNVRVPLHIDGLVKKPTIIVDNAYIMQNGKLMI